MNPASKDILDEVIDRLENVYPAGVQVFGRPWAMGDHLVTDCPKVTMLVNDVGALAEAVLRDDRPDVHDRLVSIACQAIEWGGALTLVRYTPVDHPSVSA